jgi:hypothetical protein
MIIQDQSAPPLANVDVMGLTLPPPNHHFVVNPTNAESRSISPGIRDIPLRKI